jgi:hypothetical protein
MASAVRRPGSSTGQDSATSELDELHRRSKKARSRFEPQWFLNCAYYNGDQWMKFDGGRLYQPSLEAWRLKPVDNRIQPVVRTEIAKMTKTRPDFAVTPTASDEEDIRAAAMGERVLDWLWKELDLTRKLRAGLLWSRICGAGFWKVCWDPTKGDMVEVLANLGTGQVLKDSNNRPMALHRLGEDFDPASLGENVGKKQISRGDVAVEVRTPFETFPDPLAGEEGLSAAEWLIEEVVQSEEYVLRRFNTEVEADTDAINGIAESRMPAPGLAAAAGETAKGVKVRELWALPSSKFPQGRHVVWVKDRVLQEEANPYPWLPYIMFRGIPVPGRFWPGSVTEQLISPQTELNKRKAQIGENAARIGNPPLVRSSASDFEWQGLPGEEIVFQDTGTPAAMPQFMAVPELPGYIREDVQRIEASIQDISGQHEVTQGSVPSGVTAASAINLLQEQDDTRLGPDIGDMEVALGEGGTYLLELVHWYYSDARIVRNAGEDGAWDIFDFRGAMLKGNTQVSVQAGSAMPRSRAAKQAAMTELMNLVIQYGVQVDQRSLRKFFQEYEVGGLERLFADIDVDEKQVNRENRIMSQGNDPGVNDYDNHGFHIEGHNEFRKSARFEAMPPQIKVIFEQHVQQHQAMFPTPTPEIPPGPGQGAPQNGGGPPPGVSGAPLAPQAP